MPVSKEEHEALKRKVEKIEREIEIKREVERVINSQKSGVFKYMLDFLKLIAAIIVLATAGDTMQEPPQWITDLIK